MIRSPFIRDRPITQAIVTMYSVLPPVYIYHCIKMDRGPTENFIMCALQFMQNSLKRYVCEIVYSIRYILVPTNISVEITHTVYSIL